MPVPINNAKESMVPNELAMSVAIISTTAKTWLESSIMVSQFSKLFSTPLTTSGRESQDVERNLLSSCRLIYSSERFKLYGMNIASDLQTTF
jgi:hypothetical protein